MPSLALERRAGAGRGLLVAGVDEAGRGPLAGPVAAAAVVLDLATLPRRVARCLDDSKLLPPAERARLLPLIRAHACVALGWATVAEIDRLNILRATLLAMQRAVARLDCRPGLVLVDGDRAPPLPCPAETVIGGDGISLSIAAASIVAKVTRDRLMTALAYAHPGYGWNRNAGYATEEHRAAIERLGPTPQHRRSFRPLSQLALPID